jgi:hypothetical protein
MNTPTTTKKRRMLRISGDPPAEIGGPLNELS